MQDHKNFTTLFTRIRENGVVSMQDVDGLELTVQNQNSRIQAQDAMLQAYEQRFLDIENQIDALKHVDYPQGVSAHVLNED